MCEIERDKGRYPVRRCGVGSFKSKAKDSHDEVIASSFARSMPRTTKKEIRERKKWERKKEKGKRCKR